MKVNLAQSAGFCFGVRRALEIVYQLAKSAPQVEMLGDIVHNEDVVKEIEKAGIRKVKRLAQGKNKILLIRAHGAGMNTIKQARRLGYKIVDATCPMVKEIHKIARDMETKGYCIIIIGDKKHDEVNGIVGQLKRKVTVIDRLKDASLKRFKKIKKACIVVQSTQNQEEVLKIVAALKAYLKELKFFNTICRPTRIKQEEIKKMSLKNDVVVIIGSKTSANTRRLYEISKSLNKHSYWVKSKEELKPVWFKGKATIGVTAGASTPDSTTREVIARIKQIT